MSIELRPVCARRFETAALAGNGLRVRATFLLPARLESGRRVVDPDGDSTLRCHSRRTAERLARRAGCTINRVKERSRS